MHAKNWINASINSIDARINWFNVRIYWAFNSVIGIQNAKEIKRIQTEAGGTVTVTNSVE
jgi:hypothetical protein